MNLKKFKDAYFGEFYLEQNFLKQGFLLVVEKVSNNQFEFQNRISAIKRTQKLQHPNIAQIIENKNENISSQYNTVFKNIIKYEYYDDNLKKQIFQRQDTKQYFTTSQIIKIINQTVSAFCYLQNQKLNHGEINPFLLQLKLDNQNEMFSVVVFGRLQGSRNGKKNGLNDLKSNLDIYYSPEFFLQLKEQNQQFQLDAYKSDVFSLGMCILEICLLESVQGVYDKKTISFNDYVLRQLIIKVNSIYENQKLLDILQQLLQTNPNKRMNFIEIKQYIENYQVQNNNSNQIKIVQQPQQFKNYQMIEPVSKKFSTPRASFNKQSILSHFIAPMGNKSINNTQPLSRNEYMDFQNTNDFAFSKSPNAHSKVLYQRNYSQSRYDGKEILKKFSVRNKNQKLKNDDFLKLEQSYKNFQESQLSDFNQQKQSKNFFSTQSKKSQEDKALDNFIDVFNLRENPLINKNDSPQNMDVYKKLQYQKQQPIPHVPQYVNTFELSVNNKKKSMTSNLKDKNTERIQTDKKSKEQRYNFEIKEVQSIVSDNQNLLSTQRRTVTKPDLKISNFNVAMQQKKTKIIDKNSTVVYYKDNFSHVPSIKFPGHLYQKAQDFKMNQRRKTYQQQNQNNRFKAINSDQFYEDNLESNLKNIKNIDKQNKRENKQETLQQTEQKKGQNQIQNFFCYKKEKTKQDNEKLFQKNLDYFQSTYQKNNNLGSSKMKQTSIHDMMQKQKEEDNTAKNQIQQQFGIQQLQEKPFERNQTNQFFQQNGDNYNDQIFSNGNSYQKVYYTSQNNDLHNTDKISQNQTNQIQTINNQQIQKKIQPFVPVTMEYVNNNQKTKNFNYNQHDLKIQKKTEQMYQDEQQNSEYEKLYNNLYQNFRYKQVDQENQIRNQQKNIVQTADFELQKSKNFQKDSYQNQVLNNFDNKPTLQKPQNQNSPLNNDEYFVNLQFQREQEKINQEIYQSLTKQSNVFSNTQQQNQYSQNIQPQLLQEDDSSNFSFLKNYQQCQKSFEEAKKSNKKPNRTRKSGQKVAYKTLERKLLEKRQEPSFQQPVSEDISVEDYSDNMTDYQQQENTQNNTMQNINRNEFPFFNSQNTTLNWEQNFFDRRFEPIKQLQFKNQSIKIFFLLTNTQNIQIIIDKYLNPQKITGMLDTTHQKTDSQN